MTTCSEPTRTDQLVVCPRCQELQRRVEPLVGTYGCLLCVGRFVGTGRGLDRLGGTVGVVPAELAAAYLLSDGQHTEEQICRLRARFRRLYRGFR